MPTYFSEHQRQKVWYFLKMTHILIIDQLLSLFFFFFFFYFFFFYTVWIRLACLVMLAGWIKTKGVEREMEGEKNRYDLQCGI